MLREWELDPDSKLYTRSPGLKQKLTIILALASQPELLILDEPAASMDPAARRQFLDALKGIAADKRRTILFATHITSDVEQIASHVAFMGNGLLTFQGTLEELREKEKEYSLENIFIRLTSHAKHAS